MKSIRLPLFFLAFLALGSYSMSAAQLATAKVLSVTGTVMKHTEGAANSPVSVGDILRKGDAISTDALSGAKLVFSTGAMIDVKEETNVLISEFSQQAFGGSQTYSQLAADPSQSQVLLELNYGELEGHVKKLQKDSTFDIQSPIGTAAIRGTRFVTVYTYNKVRDELNFAVKNVDGIIELTSEFAGPTGDVPQGETSVIRVNRRNPEFAGLAGLVAGFAPQQDSPSLDSEGVLEQIFTPEDPGTQIVSPNTELQTPGSGSGSSGSGSSGSGGGFPL